MKNKGKVPSLSLEEIAFKIANEPAVKDDGSPLEITKAEKILRSWAVSDNPTLQTKFMDLALQKQVNNKIEDETKQKGLSRETAYFIRLCMGLENYPGQLEQLKALEPDMVKGFMEDLIERIM